MTEHNTEKTVCPFCSSEWVTAAQHDRNVDRLEKEQRNVTEQEHDVLMNSIKASSTVVSKGFLAQPEQEPKCGAIIEVFGKDWRLEYLSLPVGKHKLYTQQYTYTTPPQRKPLTDEEITDAVRDAGLDWHYAWTLSDEESSRLTKFARAIEAAHGIKENT